MGIPPEGSLLFVAFSGGRQPLIQKPADHESDELANSIYFLQFKARFSDFLPLGPPVNCLVNALRLN